MPATSTKVMHTALMARAVKHGHKTLAEMPAGARSAIQSMMKMTDTQLEEYSHMAKKRRSVLVK